ncbi:uncharacterized protein LOC124170478 [Ischnura elegans]|uniref:uncharacterized protein LOC124170478 n=1 Tax=Ischnura elegans TaxID=197161 RepID=UPI001ED8B18B|nr:uncharacterized protein LOC124170478 [Ischnura elegans]
METYQDEDELFEEDVVFDHAGLLDTNAKAKTAIRRISTGKCAQFSKTLGLCGAFFGLGLCMAIPMPGILDPADHAMAPHTSIYTARASGYLVGSFIGGVLFDRFNRLFLLFISLLLTSLFITITPWCKILWLLKGIMVILGIVMGFLDTGCNVLCLDLWGRNSGPFMQALHFSFGLGVFIAPMLSAPFLEVIQFNVSSEVNSSFPHNIHISESQTEKLLERVFDTGDSKDDTFRVRRDEMHANMSFIFNGSDSVEVWPMTSTLSDLSSVSPSLEPPRTTSSPSLSKVHLNQSELEYSAENDSLVTSVDYLASEVDVSPEYTNSTRAPSSPTTPRIPKPKPSFTDAGKLDHTKDWDRIRVGKPPPELVAPPSVTAKSILPAPSSSTLTTSSPSATMQSSVTTPTTNSTLITTCAPVVLNVTEANPSMSESVKGAEKKYGSRVNDTSDIDVGSIKIGEIAQNRKNQSQSLLQLLHVGQENISMTAANSTTEVSTSVTTSSQVNPTSTPLISGDNVTSYGRSTTPVFPSTVVSSAGKPSEEVVEAKEKPTDVRSEGDVSGSSQLKTTLGDVNESPLQSAYKALNVSAERGSKARNSEFYRNTLEQKTERVSSLNAATNSSPNVAHITVHELDKLFQDNGSKLNTHENISSNNYNINNESQATFSKLYTSEVPPKHEHHFKPGTYDNDTEDISTLFDVLANRIEKYGFNKIQFTYLIVGMFVFSISLVFLGFLCHNPRDPKSKQEDGVERYKISRKYLWGSLVSCMSLFFFFNIGMEVTFGRYLLSFALRSDLNLSRSTGNCVTALFWGSFAAMRFASIFCASGFSPTSMLIFNFVMCSIGSIILSTLSNEVETALWLGTSFLGIGMASMFPTGILWVERYIHVSNKVAALFVMGVALGEIIFPLIVQYLMQSNQLMLMHAAAVTNALCICTFIVLWCLVAHHGEKYVSVGNVGYQLASQHDEEEDMVELSPSSRSSGVRNHDSPNELGLLLNGHPSYGH